MSRTFDKLGAALDRENYEWLLGDNPAIADAVAVEVANGGEPEAIARYVTQQIGETRQGYINRIKSAARHLESVKA